TIFKTGGCHVSRTWKNGDWYHIKKLFLINESFYILNFFTFFDSEFPLCKGFPGGSDGKASASNTGDQVQSLGWEDLLEKEMVTQSSSLAWKIPWMVEPGRLQSMGSLKVRHD
ncbi:hypothetical protein ACYT6K_09950, partial [Streptococcus pyogenes]